MSVDDYLETNRQLWNARAPIHLRSDFYDVAGFKQGRSSLNDLEREELGEIAGKSLLHLQCHFGLDTLSLARLGAQVTGVDFADVAINVAQGLSDELSIPARFLCHDVLHLPGQLEEKFDIVFTSYGVLGWLPDLHRWAEVVHQMLKPDGFLYLVEFHPAFYQYNEQGELAYDYFSSGEPEEEMKTGSYAGDESHPPLRELWWMHTLSDLLNALLSQGFKLCYIHEHAYSPYLLGPTMREVAPGQWVYSNLKNRIPYLLSLKATIQ